MYIPKEFNVSDLNEIDHFLQNNSFGILVTSGENSESVATHIPFLISKTETGFVLEGHIAKRNKQSESLRSNNSTLVIFQGPHGYISSSVYTHENVPTWNYQSVHVYGTVQQLNDEELANHLEIMVDKFESGREKRIDYKSLSPKMLQAYSQEIIGFRIESYRIEAAYKLSQNRNKEDYQRILNDLEKDPSNNLLIETMKNLKK